MKSFFFLLTIAGAVLPSQILSQSDGNQIVGHWQILQGNGKSNIWKFNADFTYQYWDQTGKYRIDSGIYKLSHTWDWDIQLIDRDHFKGVCTRGRGKGMSIEGVRDDSAVLIDKKGNPLEERKTPKASDPRGIENWSNREGNTIQAEFIALTEGQITLRRPDGQVFTFPLDTLNPESQLKALEFRKSLGNRKVEAVRVPARYSSDFYSFSARTGRRTKTTERYQDKAGYDVEETNRDTAVDMSLFFTSGPSRDYRVEVFFFGKEEDGKNIFVYSTQTKKISQFKTEHRFVAPTLIGTIKKSKSFPISISAGGRSFSGSLTDKFSVSGEKIYGWFARLMSGNEILEFETNNPSLKKYAEIEL